MKSPCQIDIVIHQQNYTIIKRLDFRMTRENFLIKLILLLKKSFKYLNNPFNNIYPKFKHFPKKF